MMYYLIQIKIYELEIACRDNNKMLNALAPSNNELELK